MFFTVIFFLL